MTKNEAKATKKGTKVLHKKTEKFFRGTEEEGGKTVVLLSNTVRGAIEKVTPASVKLVPAAPAASTDGDDD